MIVFLGADHGGFTVKERLKIELVQAGFEVEDMGAVLLEPDDDYPVYGQKVALKVAQSPEDRGVLLCRSGHGMAIVANKVAGVRAVLATTGAWTEASRVDDDANVLAIGVDYMAQEAILPLVLAWLKTPFAGERHGRRLGEITTLENQKI